MNLLALVGPALRLLNRGVSFLADKSDASPKTSSAVAVLGPLAAWVGIDPSVVGTVGKALITIGNVMVGIGG